MTQRVARAVDVVSAVLWRNGQVLLQYRVNTAAHAEHWAVPGGRVEPGESADEAITRELAEEVGIAFAPKGGAQYLYRLANGLAFAGYQVTEWGGKVTNREPEFCRHLAWFSPLALPQPLTPGTRALFTLAQIT